jgi:CobQ/CobB/MinD/ParA nucleotide binding domain.
MRYGIWNNKGGVGKTFLSFTIGLEYAHRNPDQKIVFVDMCPQANLSEILLGGNGTGSKNLEDILAQPSRLTVGGYFDERISSPQKITGNETSYVIQLNKYNENIPDNVYLICGDPSLELQAQVINQIGSQTLPVDTWKNVHSWLKDLVVAQTKKFRDDTHFFIDCNPSFSAYTELAIVASEQLIVPCSCDGSSARAIKNIADLLYGINSSPYGDRVFSKVCEANGIALPVIHSVILNRSTQYSSRASMAFRAMFEEIKKITDDFYAKKPQAFPSNGPEFLDVPDSHSVAIVSSHLGKPLYSITPGKYKVHDENPQVNSEPLDRYKEAIDTLYNSL